MKVLLLGGNGFLGKGLQDELRSRLVPFDSLDKCDMDLACPDCIRDLSEEIEEHTNIVILAAKVGRELFQTNPYTNYRYNEMIFDNVMSALQMAHHRSGRNFDVSFYSTSEVFGSTPRECIITNDTPIMIFPTGRGLYARQKFFAEEYLERVFNSGHAISNLKILRPFNVSGKYQMRGVVYDMVKSALEDGVIWYSENTIRSFTSSAFAQRAATDAIISDGHTVTRSNISEGLTFSMSDIAKLVYSAIGDAGVEMVKKIQDSEITYRQTAPYCGTDAKSIDKMYGIVKLVLEEYRGHARQ